MSKITRTILLIRHKKSKSFAPPCTLRANITPWPNWGNSLTLLHWHQNLLILAQADGLFHVESHMNRNGICTPLILLALTLNHTKSWGIPWDSRIEPEDIRMLDESDTNTLVSEWPGPDRMEECYAESRCIRRPNPFLYFLITYQDPPWREDPVYQEVLADEQQYQAERRRIQQLIDQEMRRTAANQDELNDTDSIIPEWSEWYDRSDHDAPNEPPRTLRRTRNFSGPSSLTAGFDDSLDEMLGSRSFWSGREDRRRRSRGPLSYAPEEREDNDDEDDPDIQAAIAQSLFDLDIPRTTTDESLPDE